jgi:hypothetical protein
MGSDSSKQLYPPEYWEMNKKTNLNSPSHESENNFEVISPTSDISNPSDLWRLDHLVVTQSQNHKEASAKTRNHRNNNNHDSIKKKKKGFMKILISGAASLEKKRASNDTHKVVDFQSPVQTYSTHDEFDDEIVNQNSSSSSSSENRGHIPRRMLIEI